MTNDSKEVRSKFTTLFIEPTVMKKIMYYAQAAEGEVSGLGTLIKDEKGRHVVNNVFLLEQESSGADTELSPEAISKLMIDMIGKNEDPSTLKFWWHSHANMGVFWSGTDDTCAETLSREYAFSLVVNKSGEKRCRLDLYAPFRITFDGVKVTELVQEDKDLKAECEKEVKEKVKTPTQTWKNWHDKGGYPGYDDYEGYGGTAFGRDWSKHESRPHVPNFGMMDRVKLADTVVQDIDRLLDIADSFSAHGGIFCPDVWDEYINTTLKDIVEERLEKKSACKSPMTFDKSYEDCVGKCKVKKQCAYWTRVFEETEIDAQQQLAALDESGELEHESEGPVENGIIGSISGV